MKKLVLIAALALSANQAQAEQRPVELPSDVKISCLGMMKPFTVRFEASSKDKNLTPLVVKNVEFGVIYDLNPDQLIELGRATMEVEKETTFAIEGIARQEQSDVNYLIKVPSWTQCYNYGYQYCYDQGGYEYDIQKITKKFATEIAISSKIVRGKFIASCRVSFTKPSQGVVDQRY